MEWAERDRRAERTEQKVEWAELVEQVVGRGRRQRQRS